MENAESQKKLFPIPNGAAYRNAYGTLQERNGWSQLEVEELLDFHRKGLIYQIQDHIQNTLRVDELSRDERLAYHRVLLYLKTL